MHLENSKKTLILLLLVSAVIRAILAGWIELGTDEAYYWTYAKYPDWSHYDHPGMVGWIIQLFSLNLLLDSEFFLRLASVVLMTLDTWIVFRIGCELKDEATGLRAALLYTASVYTFVITGIFILPDTPLSVFWLLAMLMMIRHLKRYQNSYLLLSGLFIGLAMLSKYTGAFLWLGLLLYFLCFDRRQFRNPYLYLSLLITLSCCLPVLVWNMQNDFISFRFHGGRVGLFGPIRLNSLGTELAGEFLYNNPVNYVVALLALVAAFRRKLPCSLKHSRLLLLIAVPMIVLFLLFSLSRPTLPHWTGPAFVTLIPLGAVWLSNIGDRKSKHIITTALTLLAFTLVLGVAEIKTGFFPLDHHTESTEIGSDDVTLDLYGWRQASEKFAEIHAREVALGNMQPDDPIIGHNWFPTASIHYYLARPLNLDVLGYGPLEQIHKYIWINDLENNFKIGNNYWYIADSHYFLNPEAIYRYSNFVKINLIDIIPIYRNGKVARNFYVYECRQLVYGPPTLNDLKEKQFNQ